MSKAGIQSNRGDGYQTLVALEWALTIVSRPGYEWLEIDSVTRKTDDVVIRTSNGKTICCQCKKNQPDHKAWTISDLGDELKKACETLSDDPESLAYFYSRSPFGAIQSLQEYWKNYPSRTAYEKNLGKAQKKTNQELIDVIARVDPTLSTYEFLSRTNYKNTSDLEDYRDNLIDRLSAIVNSPRAAFDALWTRLDHLGMRVTGGEQTTGTQHRLTKNDLIATLQTAGIMLTPPVNISKVIDSFKGTSAVGRNWRRSIAGHEIRNSLVPEIVASISEKPRSVLLTGAPGSGKTCVMLAVQDELERLAASRECLIPIFIQSSEFADLKTASERQAHGLSMAWVEEISRLAETRHVVVVIDSLDVLSISREHDLLKYFLAQIDRLLRLSNVTVFTACRDFDRQYDSRIAQRTWEREFKCALLDWEQQVQPLLRTLGIDDDQLDKNTRNLICTPRELSLFVELAKSQGSFRAGDSHALAERYLHHVIKSDEKLGDVAMRAIEALAVDMLRNRTLAVPQQQFHASQEVQRGLLSNNILHQTMDAKIAFGHQTLLDVLVVSDAVRRDLTLSEFIKNLPQVPFVRPAIRAFIAHTARDRGRLRAQVRTVLTGGHAFHIRRLVAETFAEQPPLREDWPLIRDLWRQHRDIYNVLYSSAQNLEWQSFWLDYLVPHLKEMRDPDGLLLHANRISRWKNDIPARVILFWQELTEIDWLNSGQVTLRLSWELRDLSSANAASFAPLVAKLLTLPRPGHCVLGHALAKCIDAGALNDSALWDFVAGDITDEIVKSYNWDDKLRCRPYDFSDISKTYFSDRMRNSSVLLALAIEAIERWSQVKNKNHPSALRNFLNETTFSESEDDTGSGPISSIRIFFDSVERSLIEHAASNTEWWKNNRDRICFSPEKSLQYFGVLSCISAPRTNLDLAANILCSKKILESELSCYASDLIGKVFVYLDEKQQDVIQSSILSLYTDSTDINYLDYAIMERSQLIASIPSHLRSEISQHTLDRQMARHGLPLRQQQLYRGVGWVRPPFNHDIFLALSDRSCLALVSHYDGYLNRGFDEFLVGGEIHVAGELRSATARRPVRFLRLLESSWIAITRPFREAIMEGAAEYLERRNSKSTDPQTDAGTFEQPDESELVSLILTELENHTYFWTRNLSAARVLRGCAQAVSNTKDAERVVFQAIGYAFMREEQSIFGHDIELLDIGINMAKGQIGEALVALAVKLLEAETPWPELLPAALSLFSSDCDPAVRAPLLTRLPHLQHLAPEVGWGLFDNAMREAVPGLWKTAEPCLYYAYHQKFDLVAPWLIKLFEGAEEKDLKTFGRISALAALSGRIDFQNFLSQLRQLNSSSAWSGAAAVWSNSQNFHSHSSQCLEGLQAGLCEPGETALHVARRTSRIFQTPSTTVHITPGFFQLFLSIFASRTAPKGQDIFEMEKWLNQCSCWDAGLALSHAEAYICYLQATSSFIHDHEKNLTQLLRSLFAQAEEQEESDQGEMLRRVVALQDHFLALEIPGVDEWLRAAERAT